MSDEPDECGAVLIAVPNQPIAFGIAKFFGPILMMIFPIIGLTLITRPRREDHVIGDRSNR